MTMRISYFHAASPCDSFTPDLGSPPYPPSSIFLTSAPKPPLSLAPLLPLRHPNPSWARHPHFISPCVGLMSSLVMNFQWSVVLMDPPTNIPRHTTHTSNPPTHHSASPLHTCLSSWSSAWPCAHSCKQHPQNTNTHIHIHVTLSL